VDAVRTYEPMIWLGRPPAAIAPANKLQVSPLLLKKSIALAYL